MLAAFVLAFLVGLLGFSCFLLWRAYQLGIRRRSELTRQWLVRPPPGIERFTLLFAIRDLVVATGLLSFIFLVLLWPQQFPIWTAVAGIVCSVPQLFTAYALFKLR